MIDETDNPEKPHAVGVQVEPIVIIGFLTNLIMPDDSSAVLFLVNHDPTDDDPLETWFGYRKNDKWFGICEDDYGWQEISGDVISWIPFPELRL